MCFLVIINVKILCTYFKIEFYFSNYTYLRITYRNLRT